MNYKTSRFLSILLAGIILAAPLALAQSDMPAPMDPLTRFKDVLTKAGYSLTAGQETNIRDE
jgi:hypothetical protein